MRTLAFMLLSLFFVSCATVSPTQMKKETANFKLPYAPEKGEAIIYVVRPSALGSLVRFNVFLDDEEDASEMGWNRGSQYIYFFVKPGEHTLYSIAENTADLKVSVREGEAVFVKQDASMGIIMARNSIHKIDDVAGKYHVMKLSQGKIIKIRKTISEERTPANFQKK